jgi:glutamyl-tRNA synthetase
MEGELHLDGDPKKTDKKLHWVPHTPDQHVPITMVEFDHLITVEKLEENMKFEDVIRPQSRYETPLVGEAALRNIKVNDIIQLQRRGFFRCEREFRSAAEPLVLFLIPTGKEKNMSNLSYKVGAQKREPKPATKG